MTILQQRIFKTTLSYDNTKASCSEFLLNSFTTICMALWPSGYDKKPATHAPVLVLIFF